MRCSDALETGTAEMQSIIIISSEEFSFELTNAYKAHKQECCPGTEHRLDLYFAI